MSPALLGRARLKLLVETFCLLIFCFFEATEAHILTRW